MKKLCALIFCVVTSVSSAWACSSLGLILWPSSGDYKMENGLVYYNYRQEEPALVEGVDLATFFFGKTAQAHSQSSKTENTANTANTAIRKYSGEYASDINHVYHRGKKLDGLDPTQTILLLDADEENSIQIEGIEIDVLRIDGYLNDGKKVFYRGQLLENANGAQFKRMPSYSGLGAGKYYAMDNQQIYFYGQKVAGDPQTAQELRNGYYLDNQHIYFRGEILEGAKPDEFEQKDGLIISNGGVFFRNERLAVDGHTFQLLERSSSINCSRQVQVSLTFEDQKGQYELYYKGKLLRSNYKFKALDH